MLLLLTSARSLVLTLDASGVEGSEQSPLHRPYVFRRANDLTVLKSNKCKQAALGILREAATGAREYV